MSEDLYTIALGRYRIPKKPPLAIGFEPAVKELYVDYGSDLVLNLRYGSSMCLVEDVVEHDRVEVPRELFMHELDRLREQLWFQVGTVIAVSDLIDRGFVYSDIERIVARQMGGLP